MRQIAISLILLSAFTLQAQHIESGSKWYNGTLIYDATLLEGGKVLLNATAEGQDIAFTLVPVTGEPNTYSIAPGPSDAMFVEEEESTVKHVQQDAMDLLCFYQADGRLYKLMDKTEEWDNQTLNVENWMRMIRGKYIMADGTRVTIDRDKAIVGGTYVPVEANTFNGHVTGILDIDGDGTPLNGSMEVAFVTDGLIFYPVGFDDMGFPHRLLVDRIALTECDPDNCYDYISNTLLHGCELYYYNRPTLRLMRNSILARHGYVFQSKDLKKYFGKEPWYKPADSNDNIQPSFLEQLNIELIKFREANIDE